MLAGADSVDAISAGSPRGLFGNTHAFVEPSVAPVAVAVRNQNNAVQVAALKIFLGVQNRLTNVSKPVELRVCRCSTDFGL